MAIRMQQRSACAPAGRKATVRVSAAFTKVTTKTAVATAGGKLRVDVPGGTIVVVEDAGQVYAVSNKCSHLGLPLVGKTALLQGKVVDHCIVCPAHNTAFDLATGAVKGKWCPSLPEAVSTGFGLTPPKPLPTYPARVTETGDIEVDL